MSIATFDINCLFSHKCDCEAHEIGFAVQEVFRRFSIDLKIDPFNPGDDTLVRMQTFDIEALIFLCSPESLASMPCRLELKTARRARLPISVVHLRGGVPSSLRQSSYWNMAALGSPSFLCGIENFAKAIRKRVAFKRQLRALYPTNAFHELIEIARAIALETDRTLVAESACELAVKYCGMSDPNTKYWIALALGRADTIRAGRLLDRLPKYDHPLALEGISEAKQMIRNNAPRALLD